MTKLLLLLTTILISVHPIYAQDDLLINNDNMNQQSTTLKLIYPQWQGGAITSWMPDIPAEDASRGYVIGAQILNLVAPDAKIPTATVPIDMSIESHEVEKGISGYKAILKQTKAALDILNKENPDRIAILGGECSVSVAPFTYLANKYPDDMAIVWIDAHPDINLPYDGYTGYHAMALAACFGMGDQQIMKLLPTRIDVAKSLLVGLRSWDNGMKERQEELNLKGLSPEEVKYDSYQVLNWLKTLNVSKVAIHFDLDVLDPNEMIAGVAGEPNGMLINETVRLIQDIAQQYDVVGLTIAEPMPRIAIKLKNILNQMPLLKN